MRDGTKILHRVQRDMFDDHEMVCAEVWDDLNPDYLVTTWDVGCLAEFRSLRDMAEDLMDRGDAGSTMLTLTIGIALVAQWGGVWVRESIEPSRALPPFPIHDAYAIYDPKIGLESLAIDAIGAPYPKHEFWTEVLVELPVLYAAGEDEDPCFAAIEQVARENPTFVHLIPEPRFCR